MKDKYELMRDKRGFSIASINDMAVQFATNVLSKKLLRKMWPNQCTRRTIATFEQCTMGVQLNWSTYMVNELLVDAEDAEEKGKHLTIIAC